MNVDPRRDLIAQEAAKLLSSGRLDSIEQAINRAVELLNWPDVDRPSRGEVRRHLHAMMLEELGETGYQQRIVEYWEQAEQIMTVLEHYDPILLGRGAKGHIDLDPTMHIRLSSDERIGRIADDLVLMGYDEPTFETAKTKCGRFDRIVFEDEGVRVTVTRLPVDRFRELEGTNLFSGQAIPFVDLRGLRRMICEESED